MKIYRFFKLLEEAVQIHEMATAVNPNISDLERRPWTLKLLKMACLLFSKLSDQFGK